MSTQGSLSSLFKKVALSFPVPEFLALAHYGIDISKGRVRFIGFKVGSKSLEVESCGARPFPLIENESVSHEIQSAAKVELTNLHKTLNTSFVKVVIPEDKVYVFRTLVQKVFAQDLRLAVEFKLEENVPISIHDALVEYHIITVFDNGDVALSVSVVSKKYVEFLLNLFEGTGFIPILCDTEARVLTRAIGDKTATKASLVVALDTTSTTLVVEYAGTPLFSSVSTVGTNAVAEAISRVLGISLDEAQALKKTGGKIGGEKSDLVMAEISNSLSILKDEISKVFSYWASQSKKESLPELDSLVLLGRDASIEALFHDIALLVKVPVRLGNVWRNVAHFDTYIPPVGLEDSLDYASVIGVTLVN
jgi:Tfp pilus assembly PilM family ATPase